MWQDGIRFKNRRYSDLVLIQSIGEEFTIRYDPRDLSTILIYEDEGKLLCRAGSADVLESEMGTSEVMANNARVKRELKKQIKQRTTKASAYVQEEEASKPVSTTEAKPPAVLQIKLRKHFHEKRI